MNVKRNMIGFPPTVGLLSNCEETKMSLCVYASGREGGYQWRYLCLLAHFNGPSAGLDVV